MTDPGRATTSTPASSGVVQGARTAFRWVLALFLLLGVVQIFLAGYGAFHGGFDAHRNLGFAMSGVALIALILAVVARVGGRDIGLTALLFLLAAGGQSLWAALGEDSAFFGGLHAAEGLALLGLAGFLHGTAIRRSRAASG